MLFPLTTHRDDARVDYGPFEPDEPDELVDARAHPLAQRAEKDNLTAPREGLITPDSESAG